MSWLWVMELSVVFWLVWGLVDVVDWEMGMRGWLFVRSALGVWL